MIFSFISIQAQNKSANTINPVEKKNDIKLNVTFPLFGIFEIAYERNLNENSSFGISGLYAFNDNTDEDTNYFITPFYRRYFSKKYASGFFAEGFGTLSSIDGKQITDMSGNLTINEEPDVIDFALGISLGYKWVTKGGIIIEPYAGLGGLLFNAKETDHDIVTRFGLNVGYRF